MMFQDIHFPYLVVFHCRTVTVLPQGGGPCIGFVYFPLNPLSRFINISFAFCYLFLPDALCVNVYVFFIFSPAKKNCLGDPFSFSQYSIGLRSLLISPIFIFLAFDVLAALSFFPFFF